MRRADRTGPGPGVRAERKRSRVRESAGRNRLQERNRRIADIFKCHLFPRRLVCNQGTQQLVIQRVTGLVTAECANEAVTEQVKIADGIQDLVLHELVAIAQAVFIQHPEVIEYDGIIEATAQGQLAFTQLLDFVHETEGTRTTDFLTNEVVEKSISECCVFDLNTG